ncbi:MAG: GNAT family N-acetyltransferase [Gemmatimonadaceae bacterium]|nr:GNAT family N-acetyltransferase [Gemmatimonadaceae bacterium]
MHNQSASVLLPFRAKPRPAAEVPAIRPASLKDASAIAELVSSFVADGLMLPRTREQILENIDSYVVAARRGGSVVACAALEEFSPSLAEVACVAVARSEHGNGLGSLVVLGVEQLARAREIEELFAMSLSDRFFLSLGYNVASISRYPEKLARYEKLMADGVSVVPKRCFQKMLKNAPVVLPDTLPASPATPVRKLKLG